MRRFVLLANGYSRKDTLGDIGMLASFHTGIVHTSTNMYDVKDTLAHVTMKTVAVLAVCQVRCRTYRTEKTRRGSHVHASFVQPDCATPEMFRRQPTFVHPESRGGTREVRFNEEPSQAGTEAREQAFGHLSM